MAAAPRSLERAVGKEAPARLLGPILADNGSEFSDFASIEGPALPGEAARCEACCCDVRQSRQKAGCARNHVEPRKLLPKGRGISFDMPDGRDCAEPMSQPNSEPRPSLLGMSPITMLKAAMPREAEELMDAPGMREAPYDEPGPTPRALNAARAERGPPPLC